MNLLKKCKEDPIFFIENFVLVNGQHIKLNSIQKRFLKLIQNDRNKYKIKLHYRDRI